MDLYLDNRSGEIIPGVFLKKLVKLAGIVSVTVDDLAITVVGSGEGTLTYALYSGQTKLAENITGIFTAPDYGTYIVTVTHEGEGVPAEQTVNVASTATGIGTWKVGTTFTIN